MWGAVLKKRNHFFLKVFANNIENSLFKSHHSVFHLSGKDICGCMNYLFESPKLCLECVCNSARKVRPVEEVGSKVEFRNSVQILSQ